MNVPYFRNCIAARQAIDGPPTLTVIVNNDLETKALEADTARLTIEVQRLGGMIRATTRDLNVMKLARDRAAEALETNLRALARRLA